MSHLEIFPTSQVVQTANGSRLDIVGSVNLTAEFKNTSAPITALVAKDVKHNLLSLRDCQALDILRFSHATSMLTENGQERRFIHDMADFLQQSTPSSGPPLPAKERAQVDQLMTAYPDVLGEEHVGAFKNAAPIELHFKENYRPSRVSRAPMVPIHLRAAVRKELQTLLDQDIIRPIKPGDEVKQTSRCVLVDKPDGSVRICVDLKQVNETIAYNIPYPIPHITEIVSQLPPDITYLAVFDMRRGYLHLKVHPESQKHLVFVIDPEVMNGQG